MSNIVGEVLVNIKAVVDPNQAKRDIGTGVAQGLKGVDQTVTKSLQNVKQLQDTLTRLQTARATAGAGSIGTIDKGISRIKTQLDAATSSATALAAAETEVAAATAAAAAASSGAAAKEDSLFRTRARRAASVGPLRLAGIGLGAGVALFAASQAVRELGQSLAVTGEEAETTGGRFRNFGASLLGGDVIGAVKALGNQADTLNASEAALLETNPKLQESYNQLFGAAKIGAQILADLATQADKLGTSGGTLAQALKGVNPENLTAIQSRISALAPGLGTQEIGTAVQDELRRQARERDASRDTAFQLNELRAKAGKGDQSLNQVFEARRSALAAQIATLEKAGADTTSAKSRLVTLYGQLSTVDGDIADLREKALAEQERQVREARDRAEAAAQNAFTEISIAGANARTPGQEISVLQSEAAEARKQAEKTIFTKQQRLQFELQAAVAEKSIDGIRQQLADEAARLAKEEARLAEEERKRNEAKLLRQKEAAAQLQELRLSNAEAKAALTKSTADDRKAIQAQIAHFKEIVKSTTGLEREQARTQLISARSRLKALKGTEATGGATTADFFNAAIENFRTFGSNVSGRSGVLSGQDERAAFSQEALKRLGTPGTGLGALLGAGAGAGRATTLDTVVQTQRNASNAQLAETRVTNTLLRRIAGDRNRDPRIPKVTPKYAQDEATREATSIRGR